MYIVEINKSLLLCAWCLHEQNMSLTIIANQKEALIVFFKGWQSHKLIL